MGIFKKLQEKKETGQYLTADEVRFINAHKPTLNAVKSLVQMKTEADEAGMTLKDYMQKNNLMPDPNSPAVKMIMNLHKPISNR